MPLHPPSVAAVILVEPSSMPEGVIFFWRDVAYRRQVHLPFSWRFFPYAVHRVVLRLMVHPICHHRQGFSHYVAASPSAGWFIFGLPVAVAVPVPGGVAAISFTIVIFPAFAFAPISPARTSGRALPNEMSRVR